MDGFLGTSPGNGIQLSAGKHRGRLLIPYYCTGTSPKFNAGGALISDDGGQTWRRGKAINEGRVVNGKVVDERDVRDDDATTHESVFVERANGDVLCLFRNQHHLAGSARPLAMMVVIHGKPLSSIPICRTSSASPMR